MEAYYLVVNYGPSICCLQPRMIKLIVSHFYSALCSSLCLYWVYRQFQNYLDNDDLSAMSFKRFNAEAENLYPAFSICFLGNIISKDKLKQTLNATAPSAESTWLYLYMLRGYLNMTEEIGRVNFEDVTVS